jgi:hypothetical protein
MLFFDWENWRLLVCKKLLSEWVPKTVITTKNLRLLINR